MYVKLLTKLTKIDLYIFNNNIKNMFRKDFEIYLYKNKLNTQTLLDLLPQLSSQTIKSITKDLGFKENEKEDELYVFTDGGCKKNGKSDAVAGYSVFFTDNEDSILYKFNTTKNILKDPTNNKAELSGIKYVFQTIDENIDVFKNKNIVICTDSMYSINCIEKWAKNWQKNNWLNAKGEPVKNQDIIKKIISLKEKLTDTVQIKFKHVFSHLKEPEDKSSLEYKLWYGNKKVDDNINLLLLK